ncbi:752_t:CDS:1, partial [Cetraspora pellucida]
KPDIMRLHVHLPDQHTVLFQDDNNFDDIFFCELYTGTTLTA